MSRPAPLRSAALLLLAGTLLCLVWAGCRSRQSETSAPQKKVAARPNRSAAAEEYQLRQAELVLANLGKPYLVIDLSRGELNLRLKGAVVWDCPLEIAPADSNEVGKFARRFVDEEGKSVRPVLEKYLFASRDRSPDTLLAIVSGALNVDPSLLQRDVPARFQIRWSKSLILDVSTDVVAEPKSKFRNTLLQVGQALQRPFGEARLAMKMNHDAALTFWRAVEVGLPTLLIPP